MYRFVLAAVIAFGFSAETLADDFRLLRLDDHFVKWGERSWHSGARITYSFNRTTRDFADAINCPRLVPVDGLLARSGISKPDFERAIRRAFRTWERAANLRFEFVEDADAADIVIGAQGIPRDIAYTNVWHGSAEPGRIGSFTKTVFCLNPEIEWENALDGDDQTYDVERVATHEIGHAIGLDHPGPSGALMGYRYTESVHGLAPGDIEGARRLYGPPTGESQD